MTLSSFVPLSPLYFNKWKTKHFLDVILGLVCSLIGHFPLLLLGLLDLNGDLY